MVVEYSKPADPLLGKVIKDYLFMQAIGAGGFGAVYLARHLHPTLKNQYVAAKYIDIKDVRGEEDVEREIRIMQEMQHPHIVKIRDTFLFDNVSANESGHKPRFIMMDFVRGGSLHGLLSKLNNRLLSYQVILSAMNQIATALHYVHQRNILHLDLKPANILLDPISQNEPPYFLLTDFGIAQFTRPDEQLSRWGGTPAYMSPEHFGLVVNAEKGRVVAPDHRSDIYALGIILYQLVTGDVPFHGRMHELAQAHRYAEVPPPSSRIVDVPKDLEQVILRALQKFPADRYQSVEEFRLALSDVNLGGVNPAMSRINDREVGQLVEAISTPVSDFPLEDAEYLPGATQAYKQGSFSLLVIDQEGDQQEKQFQHAPVIVGRSRHADLILDSPWVSGRHVQLEFGEDRNLIVTDLQSRNGSFLDGNPLPANQPTPYQPDQWLNLGGFSLQLLDVLPGAQSTQGGQLAPRATPSPTVTATYQSYRISESAGNDIDIERVVSKLDAQIQVPHINLRVTPEIVPAQVGRTEFLAVHVTPEHIDQPARYSLQVLPGPGVDANWYALAQPRVIRPGETAMFDVTITVPAGVRQGDYQLTLGVIADLPDIPDAVQVVQIQVRRYMDFTVSLNPNQVNHRGWFAARADLTITNNGNDDDNFAISVEAPENLRITLPAPHITIPAGQQQHIPLKLRGKKQQVAYLPYKINVSVPGSSPKQVHGNYVMLSRQSLLIRLLRVLIFAAIFALFVAIIDQNVLNGQIMLALRDLLSSILPGVRFDSF